MNNLNFNDYNPHNFYSSYSTCTNLYGSIWTLCSDISGFILEISQEKLLDIQIDSKSINAALNGISSKIDDFVKEHRGDIYAIIEGTDLGDVPADKKLMCKMYPIQSEHLINFAKIDLDLAIDDLHNTPIPEEVEEIWEEVKPTFMDVIGKCMARLEDAQEIINKMKELTKDL